MQSYYEVIGEHDAIFDICQMCAGKIKGMSGRVGAINRPTLGGTGGGDGCHTVIASVLIIPTSTQRGK